MLAAVLGAAVVTAGDRGWERAGRGVTEAIRDGSGRQCCPVHQPLAAYR